MRKRLENVRRALRGNSGSGIVLVLVCMLCVSILGVMVMYLSYTGLLLKVTERQSKADFYDASTAMDEIRAGVQKAASDSIAVAYKEMLVHYSDAAYASNMTAKFQEAFREQMKSWQTTENSVTVNLLSFANGANTGTYNADVLTSFVTSASAKVTSTADSSASYNAATNALVLKGVRVTYTDAKHYTTSVTSDITIGMPDFSYVLSSYSVSGLPSFALIADQTLQENSSTASLSVAGSAYAGNIDVSASGSLEIKSGTVICKNLTSVAGPKTDSAAARFIVDGGASLWTNGIKVGTGSSVKLAGSTYVQDDLNLAGSGSSAVLEGSYYGFGDSTIKSTESSAILVNGTGTTLDMSRLSRLMLAGHSFVSDPKYADDSTNPLKGTTDVLMGESISVRGEQRIYLAPVGCLTGASTNPEIINTADIKTKTVTLNQAYKIKNHALSEYGAILQTVYSSYPGASGQTVCYYFLKFADTNKTNQFFADYFSDSKTEIVKYLEEYTALSSMTGNPQSAGYTIKKDANNNYTLSVVATSPFTASSTQLKNTFVQLTKTLSANSVSTDKTPYTYYVNVSEVDKLTGTTAFKDENGSMVGLIVKGSYSTSSAANTVQVIIATGTVTVDSKFVGLIISGDNIILKAPVASDEAGVTAAFSATNNGITLGSFLQNGAANTSSTSGGSNSGWNLGDLITYRNWKKD